MLSINMNLSLCQLLHMHAIWHLALIVLSVFQSGAASCAPTVISSYFTAVSQFTSNGVKFRVIRSSQRTSVIRCAIACLKEDQCRYFSYTKDTRQCELSDDSIVSTNGEHLTYYRRSGDPSCSMEGPLGMEDGRIPDESITASSFLASFHGPVNARFNNEELSAAWSKDDTDISPWIQVDFNRTVTITGLITQGRGGIHNDQRVTEYQVTYSNDGQSWHSVTDAFSTPLKFPGNVDINTPVTTCLPFALRTRILRINPTTYIGYCSMRFELIGC